MFIAEIEPPPATSLEVLYSEHHDWLFTWLRKKLGCSHNAADLAHDTYLRVLVKGQVPAQDDSRRHLTRIAKGLMVDRYRRQQIETAYLDVLRELPEPETASVETQSIVIETLLEIDRMLYLLPNKIRQALLMRQLDGMSYRQISDHMNVSVSSVEKYVARGLLACYQALNNE